MHSTRTDQNTATDSLKAFASSAALADHLEAIPAATESFSVLALGRRPASPAQRSANWLKSDVDTTTVFTRALSASFGASFAAAAARELGLIPSPGKPLASKSVIQALSMAQMCEHAIAGVNFLTCLSHSAASGGVAFKAASADFMPNPADLNAKSRAEIDARMRKRFETASNKLTPITPTEAARWLRLELACFATAARVAKPT